MKYFDFIKRMEMIFYFFQISREIVQNMLKEKEELRQKEIQFKEHCRQELGRLQKELQ